MISPEELAMLLEKPKARRNRTRRSRAIVKEIVTFNDSTLTKIATARTAYGPTVAARLAQELLAARQQLKAVKP